MTRAKDFICDITVEPCPEGCWLRQQIDKAGDKLLRPARSSTNSQPETFEGQVTIAWEGLHAFERYESAVDGKKDIVRRECPNCSNLNQI